MVQVLEYVVPIGTSLWLIRNDIDTERVPGTFTLSIAKVFVILLLYRKPIKFVVHLLIFQKKNLEIVYKSEDILYN